MYIYKVTFLGGFQIEIRANTPKEAWERATKTFATNHHMVMEVVHVKFLR